MKTKQKKWGIGLLFVGMMMGIVLVVGTDNVEEAQADYATAKATYDKCVADCNQEYKTSGKAPACITKKCTKPTPPPAPEGEVKTDEAKCTNGKTRCKDGKCRKRCGGRGVNIQRTGRGQRCTGEPLEVGSAYAEYNKPVVVIRGATYSKKELRDGTKTCLPCTEAATGFCHPTEVVMNDGELYCVDWGWYHDEISKFLHDCTGCMFTGPKGEGDNMTYDGELSHFYPPYPRTVEPAPPSQDCPEGMEWKFGCYEGEVGEEPDADLKKDNEKLLDWLVYGGSGLLFILLILIAFIIWRWRVNKGKIRWEREIQDGLAEKIKQNEPNFNINDFIGQMEAARKRRR